MSLVRDPKLILILNMYFFYPTLKEYSVVLLKQLSKLGLWKKLFILFWFYFL